MQGADHLVARGAERLGRRVQVQAVAALVLDLRQQDRLALEARCPRDPVALGQHADHLGVRVLGDLADQGAPVGVRHPVLRLDLAVGGDQGLEARIGLEVGGVARQAAWFGGRALRQIHGLGVHRGDLGPRT